MKKAIVAVNLVLLVFGSNAQPNSKADYPIIGKPCPDFVLGDVNYFAKKKVSLKDFEGKPIILDMFSLGCVSCFQSFPKINKLQNEFKDKVQFLLVGQNSKERHEDLKKSYEKYQERYELRLPVAYDSAIFEQFKVNGVPHIVWIDKNGIVKAVSNGDLSSENLQNFIDGKPFEFQDCSYSRELGSVPFDITKPFLTNDNGGADTAFLYRSLWSIWKSGMPQGIYFGDMETYASRRGEVPFQMLGFSLSNFYRMAYFGTPSDWLSSDYSKNGNYYFSPLLEIKDSSLFEYGVTKNRFCYSLILPLSRITELNMMENMQRDLKNIFGYEVSIEIRKMPYLRLVATAEAKQNLLAKNKKWFMSSSFSGARYENIPIIQLATVISYNCNLVSSNLPIIDETGIVERIDIQFDAVMTDLESIKKGLKKNGLDLVKGEKEMKVIVIRDPKN